MPSASHAHWGLPTGASRGDLPLSPASPREHSAHLLPSNTADSWTQATVCWVPFPSLPTGKSLTRRLLQNYGPASWHTALQAEALGGHTGEAATWLFNVHFPSGRWQG